MSEKLMLNEYEVDTKCIANNDIMLPGEYNPHNVRLLIIGNEYGVLGAVWASNESYALDELVDQGLGAALLVDEEYEQEMIKDGYGDEISYLGNAGEPASLTNVWMHEVILTESVVNYFKAKRNYFETKSNAD